MQNKILINQITQVLAKHISLRTVELRDLKDIIMLWDKNYTITTYAKYINHININNVNIVETFLQNPTINNSVYVNCVGYHINIPKTPFILLKGVKILNALLSFVNNEFAVFDTYYYKNIQLPPSFYNVHFIINELNNKLLLEKYCKELYKNYED